MEPGKLHFQLSNLIVLVYKQNENVFAVRVQQFEVLTEDKTNRMSFRKTLINSQLSINFNFLKIVENSIFLCL